MQRKRKELFMVCILHNINYVIKLPSTFVRSRTNCTRTTMTATVTVTLPLFAFTFTQSLSFSLFLSFSHACITEAFCLMIFSDFIFSSLVSRPVLLSFSVTLHLSSNEKTKILENRLKHAFLSLNFCLFSFLFRFFYCCRIFGSLVLFFACCDAIGRNCTQHTRCAFDKSRVGKSFGFEMSMTTRFDSN